MNNERSKMRKNGHIKPERKLSISKLNFSDYQEALMRLAVMDIKNASPKMASLFPLRTALDKFMRQLHDAAEKNYLGPELQKQLLELDKELRLIVEDPVYGKERNSAPGNEEFANFLKGNTIEEYAFLKIVRHALFIFCLSANKE